MTITGKDISKSVCPYCGFVIRGLSQNVYDGMSNHLQKEHGDNK